MRAEMENCCEATADKEAANVQCASNDKVASSSVCVYNYIRTPMNKERQLLRRIKAWSARIAQ